MRAAPIGTPLVLALALLLTGCGSGERDDAARPSAPASAPSIYGGEPVASCAWPTAVYLGGCTGTLVHPELVVLAAHCVPLEPTHAIFGESFSTPAFEAPIESCQAHPESSVLGNDIGFCRLTEPVVGLPIVPPIAGCETSVLVPGAEVVAVGFGEADDALGPGPKRQVRMPIVSISERDAQIGGNGKDTCTGDSGGPVFVQLDDGTWRLFAVTSYGNTCGQGGHYSLLAPASAWLEAAAGLDLTPCHDGSAWAPTAECGAFPLEPDLGGGSWSTRCGGKARSGLAQTCGAPFDPSLPPPGDGVRARGGCAIASGRGSAGPIAPWLLLLLAAAARIRAGAGSRCRNGTRPGSRCRHPSRRRP